MKKKTFKASVNQGEYTLEDLHSEALDIIPVGDNKVHIIYEQTNFHATVIDSDFENKSFRFKINGSIYHVELADQYDQLIDRLGLHVQSQMIVKDIKAPMPGMVLEINVKAGQSVEKGDPLLILEAMKMENVIKAPSAGVIAVVHALQGKPVDKNQVLIELE